MRMWRYITYSRYFFILTHTGILTHTTPHPSEGACTSTNEDKCIHAPALNDVYDVGDEITITWDPFPEPAGTPVCVSVCVCV
jgi:hypothetical protein